VIEIPAGRWPEAYDPLTGLATLWSFLEHTNRSLQRVARQSLTVAVLGTQLMELGDPRFSDQERDDLLLDVAARLQGVLRAGDLVGRFGASGFVMLGEDLTSLDEAVGIAGRLIEVLDRPFMVSGNMMSLRAHVGVALPLGEDRADELVRRAIDAMHASYADPDRRYDVIVGSPDPPRAAFQ
jgi:diguanylate cyclase (GGDEF)-like protein